MRPLSAIIAVVVLTAAAAAQELVSFPTEDGGVVYADVYGQSERGVVLAHGGPFNKESWAKQAPVLVKAGFRVMAIDFRGYGRSRGGARTSNLRRPCPRLRPQVRCAGGGSLSAK